MDDFATTFDCAFSELQISKTCNSLLRKRIIDLERSFLDSSQYLRREMTEISPVPLEVSNDELEELVCKALSLTGNKVFPDDLEACHHLKKKGNVIIKFKSRKLKYKIINNRKIMKNKSKELNELNFSNNLYISESICAGNQLERISTHGPSITLSMFNLIRMGKFTTFSILKILRRC